MNTNLCYLTDPVTVLPYVGERLKNLLKKIDVITVRDLLYHFPSHYEDFSCQKKVAELMAGDQVTLKGTLKELKNIRLRFGKSLIRGIFADDTGTINVIWFNQSYLLSTLRVGEPLFMAGRVGESDGKVAMINPTVEETDHRLHTNRLVPIYPETKGLTSKWLRSRIYAALTISQTLLKKDYLPREIKEREGFPDLFPALTEVHFPSNRVSADKARRRFAYEELFFLQLKTILKKRQWAQKREGYALKRGYDLAPFLKSLPFNLTLSQKKVIEEIGQDLQKNKPMNRLLQGDVGSGKTIVAAVAIYTVFREGYRSFYLAPTEILAQQHYATLQELLGPLGARVHLITSTTKPKKRCHLEKVTPSESQPDLIIGTHALFYQNLSKERLALIVIDEQQRFGVMQRAKLFEGLDPKRSPHLLTMTATPIPRTLALTVFADLDLSLLEELPPGRLPVKTWVVPPEKRGAAYQWVKKQLGQAFIVCPYIEESEIETLKSVKAATKEFNTLSKTVFPEYRMGLLHGKMKAEEKNKVMEDFRQKNVSILVATPVVEVGLDIPEATVMIIEGANHFGLASLHQLRGRVGRRGQQAYCLLFSDSDEPPTIKRLKALEKYHNGQKLAEMDLHWRGPGDLYGTAQHGFPKLKIVSFTDFELIKATGEAAKNIVKIGLENYPLLVAKLDEPNRPVAPN